MAEEQGRDEQAEGEKLHRALRDAQPAWLRDGLGIRGSVANARTPSPDVHRRSDQPGGSVVRQPIPVSETTTAAQETATTDSITAISFFVSDASSGNTRSVLVADGKVASGGVSVFPSGMGFGNYILTVDNPSDALIYVLVTFDPETLAKTSVTCGVASSSDLPESRVDEGGGFLVFVLAFTYIDGHGAFRVRNRRVGDISFELVGGSMNGQPALIPVFTDPGFLDLSSLFPP